MDLQTQVKCGEVYLIFHHSQAGSMVNNSNKLSTFLLKWTMSMNKFDRSMSSCMHIFGPELQHSTEVDVEGLLPHTSTFLFSLFQCIDFFNR